MKRYAFLVQREEVKGAIRADGQTFEYLKNTLKRSGYEIKEVDRSTFIYHKYNEIVENWRHLELRDYVSKNKIKGWTRMGKVKWIRLVLEHLENQPIKFKG